MKHLGRAVSGGRSGKCRRVGTWGMENAGKSWNYVGDRSKDKELERDAAEKGGVGEWLSKAGLILARTEKDFSISVLTGHQGGWRKGSFI